MSRKADVLSSRRRRPAHSRGDLREERLLASAEALLREGRFDDAAISAIAAAADLSRPAFYFYFASKQALLERLIGRTLDELVARHAARIRLEHATAADELRGILHDVADMWVEHGVVLAAAVDLAGVVPSLFDRIEGVMLATIEERARFLEVNGTTPEVADAVTARETTESLFWMSERSFYALFRKAPSEGEYHELAERLARIWARVAGIDVDPG